MRKKSYYDKETGLYVDITTGRTYEKKTYCEICGISYWNAILMVHHYLRQERCLRDLETIAKGRSVTPSTWTQDFINKHQKLFTVCKKCHDAIHAPGRKGVINGRNLRDYIWIEEKTEVVTKPKAFVVRKRDDK